MIAFIRALVFAGVASLLAAGAQAETIKDRGLGFSVAFPCHAKQASQTLSAGTKKILLTSYTCANKTGFCNLSVSRYPKGFIAKRTLKIAYRDAVNGAAANVKGTVRTDEAYKLGGFTGRDAVIDVPASRTVAHLRVFFVGDWQYQVLFVGPKGRESGKAATEFLNSFKLLK